MHTSTSAAPGKTILFGEHAVVYEGYPAIAIPISKVSAVTRIETQIGITKNRILLKAPDIQLQGYIDELPQDHPLVETINNTLAYLKVDHYPHLSIEVKSTIPLASGLGSGAAVSVSLIQAVSNYFHHPLTPYEVSDLAYEIEKMYHGTPSGIDNTVIAHKKPVFFIRNRPFEILQVPVSFTLVIGDTGIKSPTSETVGNLRKRKTQNPQKYDPIFDMIKETTLLAREIIESGHIQQLGKLMNENHNLLVQIGVSCKELDQLCRAACEAGAYGAKLSGGGAGGNMIAFTSAENAQWVSQNILEAGAKQVIQTTVHSEISY